MLHRIRGLWSGGAVTNSGWILLAMAVLGSGSALLALLPGRHLGWGNVLWFLGALPVVELPALQGLASLLVVAACASGGALQTLPGQLGALLVPPGWLALAVVARRGAAADAQLQAALQAGLGSDHVQRIPAARRAAALSPVERPSAYWPFAVRRGPVERHRGIAYGSHPQQLLDVYRPRTAASGAAPVLVQLHGGGWVAGSRNDQALPLIYHLVPRGWIVVAADYRLSPAARFPEALIDAKRVIAWVRAQAAELGADPGFVAITGGSSGAHLAALVALTAGRAALQPGFEAADTSVQGCVPHYGVYDFPDRLGLRRDRGAMRDWLARTVMPAGADDGLWDLASPLVQVHAQAPPFFVLHGDHDSLAKVEEARAFVAALRGTSRAAVAYAELSGAQHAWDLWHSSRCDAGVQAVTSFLEWARVP